jgi:hypothetical protein
MVALPARSSLHFHGGYAAATDAVFVHMPLYILRHDVEPANLADTLVPFPDAAPDNVRIVTLLAERRAPGPFRRRDRLAAASAEALGGDHRESGLAVFYEETQGSLGVGNQMQFPV